MGGIVFLLRRGDRGRRTFYGESVFIFGIVFFRRVTVRGCGVCVFFLINIERVGFRFISIFSFCFGLRIFYVVFVGIFCFTVGFRVFLFVLSSFFGFIFIIRVSCGFSFFMAFVYFRLF